MKSSFTFLHIQIRGKHQNNRDIKPPFILGIEFAGTILVSSPDSSFKPGDRVFGGGQGGYAEYIAVKESSLHHIPRGWSFADAAGLAATASVGYGGLVIRAELKKGETVLIHGAAGGLGLMAVQVAKAMGAKVIATSGSDEKLEVARRFGADGVVNYGKGDWWKEVMTLTDGAGVDVVYDSVGLVVSALYAFESSSTTDTLNHQDKSLKCLRPTGRILIIGFAGTEGAIEKIAMNRVLLRQAQIIGYRMGMTDRLAPSETAMVWDKLKELWESGLLKPTVYDQKYRGLESVKRAMRDLHSRTVWGKAVVLVGQSHDQEGKKAKL